MRFCQEVGQGRSVGSKPASRPARILRAVAILAVLLIAIDAVLVLAFPRIGPQRLGAATVNAALLLIGAGWLWAKRRGWAISCCVALVVLTIWFSFAVVNGAEERHVAFRNAARGEFVLEGTGGRSILHHRGLGITVEAPGRKFTTASQSQGDSRFGWVFLNSEQSKALVVAAENRRIAGPKELEAALLGVLHAFDGLATRIARMKMTVEQAGAVWKGDEKYGEATGAVGTKRFCIRVLGTNSTSPAYNAVVAVMAVAKDNSSACSMARSLRVAPWAAAGVKRTNPAR